MSRRSSVVEQLIRNQQVAGSTPIAGSSFTLLAKYPRPSPVHFFGVKGFLALRSVQFPREPFRLKPALVLARIFSPTQIKSIFNRGTFDGNNANILYERERPYVEESKRI
jgi:hypothetical protein